MRNFSLKFELGFLIETKTCIFLFLTSIADSKEILTYSDKYSIFNINYYI